MEAEGPQGGVTSAPQRSPLAVLIPPLREPRSRIMDGMVDSVMATPAYAAAENQPGLRLEVRGGMRQLLLVYEEKLLSGEWRLSADDTVRVSEYSIRGFHVRLPTDAILTALRAARLMAFHIGYEALKDRPAFQPLLLDLVRMTGEFADEGVDAVRRRREEWTRLVELVPGVRFDQARKRLVDTRGTVLAELTGGSSQLLDHLLRHLGMVVSKREISRWFETEPAFGPDSHAVEGRVYRLRQALLATDNRVRIRTVHGRGYVLELARETAVER